MDSQYQDLQIIERFDSNPQDDRIIEEIARKIAKRNISPTMTRQFNSSGVVEFKNIDIGIYYINFDSSSEDIDVLDLQLYPILVSNDS